MDDDFDPLLSEDEAESTPGGDESVRVEYVVNRAERSLALRRAIEERMEQRRLQRDLDYLEIDD